MFKFTINGSEITVPEADGLTRVQAAAVAVGDAHPDSTNEERGGILTEVLGDNKHRTGGTYGNLRVSGLRALGREAEIGSTGPSGPRLPAARLVVNPDGSTNVESLRDALKAVESATAEAVEPLTVAEYREREANRLAEIRNKVNAEIKSLREASDDDLTERVNAHNDDARTRAEARAEAVRNRADEYRAAINEATEWEAFRASRAEVNA